jgi:uncharacterized cofD-like protein
VSPGWFKWFAPGMRIKRWLFVATLGGVIFSVGLLLAADFLAYRTRTLIGHQPVQELIGAVLIAVGLATVIWSLRCFFSVLSSAVASHPRKQLVEVLYDRRYLDQGLKLVAIGGGTGLSTLLRGLKNYTSNVTAVVAVSDDGGSSGKLRKEFGILAPGDVRNCLVALADDESLLKELFRYRFSEGGLEGHSFGNLFLAALTDLAGDFEVAIQLSSQILAVRGRVLPATLSPVNLSAHYSDGSVVTGESRIPKHARDTSIERIVLVPEDVKPPAEVIHAIEQADAIILGPGSLYTSVIPNLLVEDIGRAVRQSTAPKMYVCNVMTQPGETDGMGAADHVEGLLSHADVGLDYVLVNLGDPEKLAEKYRAEGALPVDPQLDRLAALRVEGIGTSLISETDWVRHDPDKLARTIIDLIARHRGRDSGQRSSGRLRVVK